MPIHDIYSKRQQRATGGEPEVYQYEDFSKTLRSQIKFILENTLGAYEYDNSRVINEFWSVIRDALRREWGVETLAGGYPIENDIRGLLREGNAEQLLDLIDLVFQNLVKDDIRHLLEQRRHQLSIKQTPDDAIKELNIRLREAGVGYQLENGRIVRVDKQFVHAEAVVPALTLLGDKRFSGPEQEFRSAHDHYRKGQHREAITDANSAFESTMKTVCEIKKWKYSEGATASGLVKVLRKNGLLPDYLDKSFDQLVATLTSGLPQVRNKGAHGQGSKPRETPAYIASYALHLAAVNIVMIVEAMKATDIDL